MPVYMWIGDRRVAMEANVTDGKKRALKEWLDEKKMTPDALMRAGARVSTDVLTRWSKTGQVPPEVTANAARCIDVADALGIPVENLDCGPFRRGVSEAGYRILLSTRQTRDHDWEASLAAWGPPKDWPPRTVPRDPIRRELNDRRRVKGPTAEASLDALETQFRELIRANPGHQSAVHEA